MPTLPATPPARKAQHWNNVVVFRRPSRPVATIGHSDPNAFGRLTAALVMERHRRGQLEPEILEALLAGVGLEVPR